MAAGPAVAKHTTHNDQAQRMTQPHHTATLNSPHGRTATSTHLVQRAVRDVGRPAVEAADRGAVCREVFAE